MESAHNTAWSTFQQTERLTTRIHNILNDYPPGVTVLREFLQNADDAKADTFHVCLDCRTNQYSTNKLLSRGLEQYYTGPSILVYNNSIFSENDFQSLISIGNSGKKKDSNTIGRYGLGFNASFHLTDMVSFISGDDLVMFDPHGKSLPNGVLGLRSKWADLEKSNDFSDTVLPFTRGATTAFSKVCGHEDSKHFLLKNGTVFRLPLRTIEQGKKSLLSQEATDVTEAQSMIQDFCKNATEALLFLKNVQNISVTIVTDDGNVKVLQKTSLSDCIDLSSPQGMGQDSNPRCSLQNFIEARDKSVSGSSQENYRSRYILKFNSSVCEDKSYHEEWLIYSGADTSDVARVTALRAEQIPWGGIAVKLFPKSKVEGRAYCFLPLPIVTGLPVHVNAAFALSSDRRNLWSNSDIDKTNMHSKANWKGEWNNYLLETFIPTLYSEACGVAVSTTRFDIDVNDDGALDGFFYSAVWPDLNIVQKKSAKFYQVAEQTIRKIAMNNVPVFFTNANTLDLNGTESKLVNVKKKTGKSKKKAKDGNSAAKIVINRQYVGLMNAIFVGKAMEKVLYSEDRQSVKNFHTILSSRNILMDGGAQHKKVCLSEVPEFVKESLEHLVPDLVQTTNPYIISSLFKGIDLSLAIVHILVRYFLSVHWFDDFLVDKDSGKFICTNELEIEELHKRCVEGPMCFQFLCGMKILPLRPSNREKKKSVRFGTFNLTTPSSPKNKSSQNTKNKNKKQKNGFHSHGVSKSGKLAKYYLVQDSKYYDLVEESHRIVCFECIPEIRKLINIDVENFESKMAKYNVTRLSPYTLIDEIGLDKILPSEMEGRPMISLGNVDYDHTHLRSIDKLALSQYHNPSLSSTDGTKRSKKDIKYAAKAQKQSKRKKKKMKIAHTGIMERQQQNDETSLLGLLFDSGYVFHPERTLQIEKSISNTVKRIALFWQFLSEYAKNLVALMCESSMRVDTWPLIPVIVSNEDSVTRYFVSYKYAKFRSLLLETNNILNKKDLSRKVNNNIVRRWGALYLDTKSSCVTDKLKKLFDSSDRATASSVRKRYLLSITRGLTKKDILQYQQNDSYQDECLALRDEILSWYGLLDIAEGDGDSSLALDIVKRSIDDQTASLLKRLPIFSTLDPNRMVSLSTYISDKNGHFPNCYGTPGHIGISRYEHPWRGTSEWDTLLRPICGQHLLSYKRTKERYMLMLANNPRPDIFHFMSSPFFLSILGDDLPMSFCFELLKIVGENKLKKYSNMEELLKKLANSRLIVYDNGERLKPCEVVDPADELLVSILLKRPEAISNDLASADVNHEQASHLMCPFPPQAYVDDKDVMDALRSLGCVTLSKFESFLRVAKIVAAESNIDGGKFLCKFMMEKYNTLGWTISEWNQLHRVEFVPAYVLNQSYFPFYSNASITAIPRRPKASVLKELDRCIAKRKKTNVRKGSKSSNRRHKFTRQIIEELLEDETTDAIDYDEDGKVVGVRHMKSRKNRAIDISQVFCTALERFDVKGGAYDDEDGLHMKLIPFFQPDAILRVDAIACWTSAVGVLPPYFDRASIELLRAMGVTHTPKFGRVVTHLRNIENLWSKFSLRYGPVSTNIIKSMQACVLSSCAILADARYHDFCKKNWLRSQLKHCKFIVLDTGKLVAPKEICIDLDEQMGSLAVPVPLYLSKFCPLLREIGSLSMEDLKMPVVSIKGTWPLEIFKNGYSSIFNDKTLSDVRFAVKTSTCATGFKYFYCHKLILGMVSEAFMKFFSGGMGDSVLSTAVIPASNDNWAGTTIQVDEWVDEISLELFLKYVYGVTKHSVLASLPIDETTTMYSITIMRLADLYMLSHLKSLMEYWLSSNDVIDIYNVTSLLSHASACRAHQLLRRCIFIARQMYSVVSQSPEWEEFKFNFPDVVDRIEYIPTS